MILAGTGHRPTKLGGYKLPNPTYIHVCQQIEKYLLELKPDKVISGFALGYDQWICFIANKLNIPVIAAIPFIGQELAWPISSQNIYNKLLNKASEVIIVSPGGYSAEKLQIRNEFMVDHCDILLACYDGSKSGTANCIKYAEGKGRIIKIINPALTVNL